MRKYRRMTYTDRLFIEKLYNAGASYRDIADRVGFSVGAVHREVQRGLVTQRNGVHYTTFTVYSATVADDDAKYQASSKGAMVKLDKRYDYAFEVSDRIKSGESPDAIVGDLRRQKKWTVSTPTLYRYIDQGFIPDVTNNNLVHKRNKKRTYRKVRAAKPPRGETIERRPSAVNSRSVPGHWEMDTVIGKKSGKDEALLVLTERLTRYEIIMKMHSKTSDSVIKTLSKVIKQYPDGTFKTLTVDNGTEFSDYAQLKTMVNEVYYCHPFCSSERGSNENANRLIRRFFPKFQSLASKVQSDCDAVAYFINHMHRRILNYCTSAELFNAWQYTLV